MLAAEQEERWWCLPLPGPRRPPWCAAHHGSAACPVREVSAGRERQDERQRHQQRHLRQRHAQGHQGKGVRARPRTRAGTPPAVEAHMHAPRLTSSLAAAVLPWWRRVEQVTKYAFSGGGASLELHKQHGANLDVSPSTPSLQHPRAPLSASALACSQRWPVQLVLGLTVLLCGVWCGGGACAGGRAVEVPQLFPRGRRAARGDWPRVLVRAHDDL